MAQDEYTTRDFLKKIGAVGAVGATGPVAACLDGNEPPTESDGGNDGTPTESSELGEDTENTTESSTTGSGSETFGTNGRWFENTLSPYKIIEGTVNTDHNTYDPELIYTDIWESRISTGLADSIKEALFSEELLQNSSRRNTLRSWLIPLDATPGETESWFNDNFNETEIEYQIPDGWSYGETKVGEDEVEFGVALDRNESRVIMDYDRHAYNDNPLIDDFRGAIASQVQTTAGIRDPYQETHSEFWDNVYRGIELGGEKLEGEIVEINLNVKGQSQYAMTLSSSNDYQLVELKENGEIQ